MAMDRKIDIIIITGFLGAGKTTLLNKLVTSCSGQNIGLLVNDFGQIPVDGSLIQDSTTDLNNNRIYEIGNGSIFCSCLTSSFVFGLKYFIQKAPDVLFIETSGMSDPSSMAKLLSEYKLMEAYRIRHVLCVVDSTNVLKLRKNMAFVDRQIYAANTVLANKSDLIDESKKNDLSATIKEVNDGANFEFTSYCDFDFSALDQKPFRLEGDAQSCNTSDSAPKTMLLPQIDIPETRFLTFLGSMVDKTMRLKGYYSFRDSEYYFSNNNGIVEVKLCKKGKTHERGITLIYEGKYHDEIQNDWKRLKEVNGL